MVFTLLLKLKALSFFVWKGDLYAQAEFLSHPFSSLASPAPLLGLTVLVTAVLVSGFVEPLTAKYLKGPLTERPCPDHAGDTVAMWGREVIRGPEVVAALSSHPAQAGAELTWLQGCAARPGLSRRWSRRLTA